MGIKWLRTDYLYAIFEQLYLIGKAKEVRVISEKGRLKARI